MINFCQKYFTEIRIQFLWNYHELAEILWFFWIRCKSNKFGKLLKKICKKKMIWAKLLLIQQWVIMCCKVCSLIYIRKSFSLSFLNTLFGFNLIITLIFLKHSKTRILKLSRKIEHQNNIKPPIPTKTNLSLLLIVRAF